MTPSRIFITGICCILFSTEHSFASVIFSNASVENFTRAFVVNGSDDFRSFSLAAAGSQSWSGDSLSNGAGIASATTAFDTVLAPSEIRLAGMGSMNFSPESFGAAGLSDFLSTHFTVDEELEYGFGLSGTLSQTGGGLVTGKLRLIENFTQVVSLAVSSSSQSVSTTRILAPGRNYQLVMEWRAEALSTGPFPRTASIPGTANFEGAQARMFIVPEPNITLLLCFSGGISATLRRRR